MLHRNKPITHIHNSKYDYERIDNMRKTINVTNDIVLETLESSSNASKLIEIAILYYLGLVSKDYIEKYKEIERAKQELRDL